MPRGSKSASGTGTAESEPSGLASKIYSTGVQNGTLLDKKAEEFPQYVPSKCKKVNSTIESLGLNGKQRSFERSVWGRYTAQEYFAKSKVSV